MSDDPFDAIVEGLEIEVPETKSVQDMSKFELGETLHDTRQKLIDMGEMMIPKTEEGRELHSLRAACLIEMKRRGL